MAFDPQKGRAALRRGRISQSYAEYFLTFCTTERGAHLHGVAGGLLDEMHAMSNDGTWTVRCATVMPDHVHMLIRLGARLTLGQSLRRLKAKTSSKLDAMDATWERDFFDRKMRLGDNRRAVFLYIYLNPYRANVCKPTEPWPWYYCCPEDWSWFQHDLKADLPSPEWLM